MDLYSNKTYTFLNHGLIEIKKCAEYLSYLEAKNLLMNRCF